MKILKWVFIVLAIILALLLIFSATQPNKIEVEESIVIDAPAQLIFKEIGDFTSWDNWSAWNQMDTNMQNEYSENMGEVGSFSRWESKVTGNGEQEIIELIQNEYIKTEMEFNGWDGKNYAAFNLEKVDGGTKLTWSFDGAETPFYMNLMNTFMKPMLEESYKKSLNNLKTYIESMPEPSPEETSVTPEVDPMGIQLVQTKAQAIISIKDSTTIDGISKKLAELYTELSIFAATEQIEITGMPLAFYYKFSPEGVVLEAGMPTSKIAEGEGRVMAKEMPSGKAVKGIFYGNYDDSGKMHDAIIKYCTDNNIEMKDFCWEVYANDPEEVDEELIETHIYYPIN